MCSWSFMLPWKLRKRRILPVNQNLHQTYFSACVLQSFFCHDLANDTHSQTAKAVSMYSHLKFHGMLMLVVGAIRPFWAWLRVFLTIINGELARRLRGRLYLTPTTHRHSKTAFALLYRHIYKAIFMAIAKHWLSRIWLSSLYIKSCNFYPV